MKTFKVLLCDDDDWDRSRHPQLIEKRWNEMFGEVIVVHGCSDIIDHELPPEPCTALSKVGQYDALLLDIWWGKADSGEPRGRAIATQVRLKYPELPIILLSGQVTLEDFQYLIPHGIAAYLTKTAPDASTWCAEIHRVLEQAGRERAGYPLFQLLRRLLSDRSDAWCRVEIGEAASEVWRHENAYGKWEHFWSIWDVYLGNKNIAIPCNELANFFCGNELLMLSVHESFRGHLEHVLHVYFTGYIISHRVPGFRDCVLSAVRNLLGAKYSEEKEDEYWDLFHVCWLIAATLHDLAYPLEMLPDVVQQAERIHQLFPYAEFSQPIGGVITRELNWSTPQAREAKEAFRFVLSRLYPKEEFAEFIQDNAIYVNNTTRRFNHGVASGARFINEASKWASAPNAPPVEFLRWTATAMALHSLKHAGQNSEICLALKGDPLAFLLSLCDELQVWNRSRPDETPTNSDFRRVELIALGLEGSSLSATLEYDFFPGIDNTRRREIVRRVTARINKDQRILQNYLKPDPLVVVIHSQIKDPPEKLPSITLKCI